MISYIFYCLLLSCILALYFSIAFLSTASLILFSITKVLTVIFALLFLATLFTLFHMFKALISAAPYAPTPHHFIDKMIGMAEPKPGEVLVDIGSGDGRVVLKAAETGADCIGLEIQPYLYWRSKHRIKKKGIKNAKILKMNLWDYDFSGVNVLTLFMIPHRMKKLKEKIQREMKYGSRVVSYEFQFPDWKFAKKDGRVYLYIVT